MPISHKVSGITMSVRLSLNIDGQRREAENEQECSPGQPRPHASSITGNTTEHASLSPTVKLHVLLGGRSYHSHRTYCESEKIRRRDTGAFL